MNLCLRSNIRNYLFSSLRSYSSVKEVDLEAADQEVIIEDPAELAAKEAEIQKKRNVSRLNKQHFNLINGRRPYDQPKCLAHFTVKYSRKMYGQYGSASGVNPSLCWPSKNDIAEVKEYESVAYPYTIQQMMDMVAEKRKKEQQDIEQREIDVAARFAKLAQWKKDLEDRIAKKAAEAEAAKLKKRRLVEEVRRHFGFKLDPRDERFQEMLAKREKEQKKVEKLAKRDAKEKAMLVKLQQKNVEIKDAAAAAAASSNKGESS